MYICAMCGSRSCRTGELDKAPLNCPCKESEQEQIKELYQDADNNKLAYWSAMTEAEGYCKKTRLEEIIDFADKCGYKKLGLAFCIGLEKEANVLCKILTHNEIGRASCRERV